MGVTSTNLPLVTGGTEDDEIISNVSGGTRRISFKTILEKISFKSLTTNAKNIIGAVNELNTKTKNVESYHITTTSTFIDGVSYTGSFTFDGIRIYNAERTRTFTIAKLTSTNEKVAFDKYCASEKLLKYVSLSESQQFGWTSF